MHASAKHKIAQDKYSHPTTSPPTLSFSIQAVTGTGKGFTKSLKDRRSEVLQQRRVSAADATATKYAGRPTPLPSARATPASSDSSSSASFAFGSRTGTTPSSLGAPFVVKKSSKPLTQFKEFNLSAGDKKREDFTFKPHTGPVRGAAVAQPAVARERENRKPTPKRTPVKHTKLSAMREERIAKLKEGQKSARKAEFEARRV
jgi:hypothetical protein